MFGDVIANMISNEKRNSIITELFIRGKKLNISIVFMNKSFFEVPKEVRFYTLVFWKFQTKDIQQIAISHSSDIDFEGFMNIYGKCIAKPYSFVVSDATLPSDNPSCFRQNLLKRI